MAFPQQSVPFSVSPRQLQPSINSDALTRHTRIPGNHHERIRTIAQVRVHLQDGRVLETFHRLGRVLEPPLGQQQARQDGVDSHLGTGRLREAPHEVQLRGLGDRVRHRRAADGDAGYGRGHDEDSALRVGGEDGLERLDQGELGFDVYGPALPRGC